jgi:Bacterial Ig-like domain (group 2)
MTVRGCLIGIGVSLLCISACGESDGPTGPSDAAVPAAPRVNSVAVAGVANFFQRGQTSQLRAEATLSNGFVEDRSASATWSSDNTGVASVSNAGVVTIGNEGEATISATLEGVRGTMRVRVVYGNRTPDPPPGQRIPRPDESGFIRQLFAERPDLVARSCQPENGGNGTWEFMDFVIDRLRSEKDLRWGYNSRRGVPGDVARDEVAYHWGPGPDEGSRDVYAWDVMGGHCGPNPTPVWIDVTDLGVLWASRGRF